MSEIEKDVEQQPLNTQRRRVLKASALALLEGRVGAGR